MRPLVKRGGEEEEEEKGKDALLSGVVHAVVHLEKAISEPAMTIHKKRNRESCLYARTKERKKENVQARGREKEKKSDHKNKREREREDTTTKQKHTRHP